MLKCTEQNDDSLHNCGSTVSNSKNAESLSNQFLSMPTDISA